MTAVSRRWWLRTLSDLPLGRKVALIPALTLLMASLMLALFVHLGVRNTAALRALDHAVYEPLNQAQTLKDDITRLHTRLFAVLAIGNDRVDPAARKASAADLAARLDATVTAFNAFLAGNATIPQPLADRLRQEMGTYAARLRETAGFAASDASHGAMLAGTADADFDRLHAYLDALVQFLADRRAALTTQAVAASLKARELMLGLGLGTAMLGLLGSVAIGRSIAGPLLRLTVLMKRLAGGDSDFVVPGRQRQDEVGAIARAIEVFRANIIARRDIELALRRTNLQLDAALNSMLQGMLVWGPDYRLQLVNGRFFAICDLPPHGVRPGMTVAELIQAGMAFGLFPEQNPREVRSRINGLLSARRSVQTEMAMRPGLRVQVACEPMANGGAVITLEDVTEKRRNEEQIAFMAHHDTLTGLANRALFREYLNAAIMRPGQPFAVLCLDLDRFKDVNDTLGHAVGDELLRLVAGRLRQCVRDGDIIARLGGDEFAIVLNSAAGGAALAVSLAERLIDSIGAPYEVQGHSIVIGVSIGIALAEPDLPGAELLKRADVALYRAKEERGTFAFFETGMDEDLRVRLGLEADLRLAMQRNELALHYQPLYNFAADRITAVEALLRWNSPARGSVPPAEFIPLAEQTGLIAPIGQWVLRTACAEAVTWPTTVRVAVNLSPAQFRHQQLVAIVRDTLAETGLPADRLELEITETVLRQDTEAVMATLHGLHELGVHVSLDDFGTGYSSLNYLRRFPFDKIKIDRSFVGGLMLVPAEAACDDTVMVAAKSAAMIVRAITGLGENLGIATTAEGVETAQQFAQIRHEGCTEVQGYFISPPRPAAEIEALLRRLDATLPMLAGGEDASARCEA
ncbi:putative bifunctional diguanylate cyclase/phosphodiesterase [Rhodopila globiformis]|nr:EAL domain-containing protein [Rhodopila globiformis]